jgi:hypothetical protein
MQPNDRVHITEGPLKGREGVLIEKRRGRKWAVLVTGKRHVIKEEHLYRLAPEPNTCPVCHARDVTTQINDDGVSGSWRWQIDTGATVTVEWDEKVAVVDVPGVGTQQLRHDDPAYLALESLIVG